MDSVEQGTATANRVGKHRVGEGGLSSERIEVCNPSDLLAAVSNPAIRQITIQGTLSDLPVFRLAAGQSLVGAAASSRLLFAPGEDGVQLSADNTVADLELRTDADRRAVFNDTSLKQLGRLEVRSLRLTGALQLLARDQVRGGHIEAHDIDVISADARGYEQRPEGYGVQVLPGGFTVWNQQVDPTVTITADLTGISVGRPGAPVRGTGVFVGGAGQDAGRLVVSRLETGAVFSDGGIAPGTSDRIAVGVFVSYGALVDIVHNREPVTTYGSNDMVLDNWGEVDRWTVDAKATSHGPSAIGFVNFGTINALSVAAPIETFGTGSRGFNVYAGTVHRADFDRVVTHGDGAVGIQISQPIGCLTVRRGVATFGCIGASLVKGVMLDLPATAFSIKPGGSVREVEIAGGLVSHGSGVEAMELRGSIGSLKVTDGLAPAGGGFGAL